jgi:hypothetical protein
MPAASRLLVAACLVGGALGFEQLAGFKMPSLQGMKKAIENQNKFGDKKLAVVTGTSSGARPAPPRPAPPSRRPTCGLLLAFVDALSTAHVAHPCSAHPPRARAGLGRATAAALLRTGEYHVIGAVRDLDKVSANSRVAHRRASSFR